MSMRWAFLLVSGIFLIAKGNAPGANVAAADVSLSGPTIKAGALKFTVPSRWQSVPVENPESRAAQWHVPVPHGEEGDGGEVVVFYFGPKLGGDVKENIDAWDAGILNPDGHPAAGDVKTHMVNGTKMTVVALFGSYNQPSSISGLPPVIKANYGLLGAVVENGQGNIYWRFTGPEALIRANLPLFNKILDSVKPQEK